MNAWTTFEPYRVILGCRPIDPTVTANAIGTAALTVAILSLGFGLDGRLSKRSFMKLCSTMFDEQSQ